MSGWNFGLDSIAQTSVVGSRSVLGKPSSSGQENNAFDLEVNGDRTFPLFGNNPYLLLAQEGGIVLGTPENKLEQLLETAYCHSIDRLKESKKALESMKVLLKQEWAMQHLIKLLSSKDDKLRSNAASALEAFGDERAVIPLTQRLNDESIEVRLLAGRALTNLGDERAIQPLLECLGNIRCYKPTALLALGELGDRRSFGVILKALKVEKNSSAAIALGSLGDKRAVPALVDALSDPNAELRKFSAIALGALGDNRAVAPLIKSLLTETNVEVRRFAGQALGQLKDKTVIPILLERAKDRDPRVKELAIKALGWVGAVKAVTQIAASINDDFGNAGLKFEISNIISKLNTGRIVLPQGIRLVKTSAYSAKLYLPELPLDYAYVIVVDGSNKFTRARFKLLPNLKPDTEYNVSIRLLNKNNWQESVPTVIKFKTLLKSETKKPKAKAPLSKPKPKKCLHYKPYSNQCNRWEKK